MFQRSRDALPSLALSPANYWIEHSSLWPSFWSEKKRVPHWDIPHDDVISFLDIPNKFISNHRRWGERRKNHSSWIVYNHCSQYEFPPYPHPPYSVFCGYCTKIQGAMSCSSKAVGSFTFIKRSRALLNCFFKSGKTLELKMLSAPNCPQH